LNNLKVFSANYKNWNSSLNELNATLGAKKQVNIIVVIAKNVSNDFIRKAPLRSRQNFTSKILKALKKLLTFQNLPHALH
jgi:hypothetical protein